MGARQEGRTDPQTTRATIPIYDLECGGGGVLTLERVLAKVPGVAQAYVNPATEMAYVEYDPATAGSRQLVGAIESAGFGAGEVTAR